MNPKENLIKAIKCEEPEWIPCPMVDGCWRIVFHNLLERQPLNTGKFLRNGEESLKFKKPM